MYIIDYVFSLVFIRKLRKNNFQFDLKVNPSDVGIYDRVVIQELIKTVASAQQIHIPSATSDSSGPAPFKVVVITEVDRLSKDAQHALRRTMEKYMATCRIILMANSTSKVIFQEIYEKWLIMSLSSDYDNQHKHLMNLKLGDSCN